MGGKAKLKRHRYVTDKKVESGLAKHGFQTDGVLSRSVNRQLEHKLRLHESKDFTDKMRSPEHDDQQDLNSAAFRAEQKKFHKNTGGMNRAGPGDKEIHTKCPKHLFTGKRGFDLDRR